MDFESRWLDAAVSLALFLVQAFPAHPCLKPFRNDIFHAFDLEVYHPASKVASTRLVRALCGLFLYRYDRGGRSFISQGQQMRKKYWTFGLAASHQ